MDCENIINNTCWTSSYIVNKKGILYHVIRHKKTFSVIQLFSVINLSTEDYVEDYKIPPKVFMYTRITVKHIKSFGRKCWLLFFSGRPSVLNCFLDWSHGLSRAFIIFRDKFLFCNVACLQKELLSPALRKTYNTKEIHVKSIFKFWTRMLSLQQSLMSGRQRITAKEHQILSRKASNGEGTIKAPYIWLYKASFSPTPHNEVTN